MGLYNNGTNIIIENQNFSLTINAFCQAENLIHKQSGEECLDLSHKMPLFSVTQDRLYNNELKLTHPLKTTTFSANSIKLEGENLIVGFELVPYEAVVKVKISEKYIAFNLEDFIVKEDGYKDLLMPTPPVSEFRIMQLPIKRRKNFGHWLNVSFDERAAVNLLATSQYPRIDAINTADCDIMTADLVKGIKLKGAGAALIVSNPDKLLDAIEDIENDYNLPKGVKSRRDNRINASAYWTECIYPENVDEHIAYAKKGGFRLMLIYYRSIVKEEGLYDYCGNYDFNEHFPRGTADLEKMLNKIKAAGITPGLHVLHTHIGLKSRYLTPKADHRINLKNTFTLSKPINNTDTCVFVEQNPECATLIDGCRVLNFGGELISYEGYSTEYPYCFKGIKRGFNNTEIIKHSVGEIGGVIDISEFGATSAYLNQESSLQEEIAEKIATLYNAGFEYIYLDGSEGTNAPFDFHIPNAQYRVYKKLNPEPLLSEGAAKSHFSWHMLSGGNAFDIFPTKIFKEKIVEFPAEQAPRMANDFTRINFGWWEFFQDTMPDTYEFGTSRAAAFNCPGTMKAPIDKFKVNPRTDDILEVLRRWEDVRATNWLTELQKQELKNTACEHTLLINENGEYELTPYERVALPVELELKMTAYFFERKGYSYLCCWHNLGEGQLHLPTTNDITYLDELNLEPLDVEKTADGVKLPLSKRRYIKTSLKKAEFVELIKKATVL